MIDCLGVRTALKCISAGSICFGSDRAEALLDERDTLVIQDKSGQHIEEPGFGNQSPCRFGEITPKVLRGLNYLLKQRVPSFNDRNKVFKIVTRLKIHSAASSKCFHLCPQEERRGNDTDRFALLVK